MRVKINIIYKHIFQLKKKMAKVPEQMADGKRTYPKKIYVHLFLKKKYNHLAVYMVHVMCCTVVYKHWKKKING
jgi:hypothetical protein